MLRYFHNLQNRSGKINVHATHTVHAVPDLRMTGGRFGGRKLYVDCYDKSATTRF